MRARTGRPEVPTSLDWGCEYGKIDGKGKLNWIAYLGERMRGFEKIGLDPSTVDQAGFWAEQNRFDTADRWR